jgi:RimJ/RimL family protein N-acetyltransferase
MPVTNALAASPEIIEHLFRWRQVHMESFVTVFTPWIEKTRHYLSSFSLPDPARALFMLCDRNHRFVGHIGLCGITPLTAEIDNVIRGEPPPAPKFMASALLTVLRWTFKELDIPSANLHVLSNNRRAIELYRIVGFIETSRAATVREATPDGYRLIPATSGVAGAAGPDLISMTIDLTARRAALLH